MLIELRAVSKIFNAGMASEVVALLDIDLQVEKGSMVCLQGPSGSGKTTLLSIIGCILVPTSGYAAVDGRKISRLPDNFLTSYRRETVGFIFQDYNLLPHLSVVENISLPLYPLGVSPRQRARRADRLIDRFGLSHRRNFPLSKLSGGEVQRVAIARALICNPPLLVADEPTAHLDEKLAGTVLATFAELKDEGKTIVLSSHDPAVARCSAVDKVLIMESGRLAKTICRS